MPLTIKTLDNKIINIEADENDNILDIKNKISKICDKFSDKNKIILAGRILEDTVLIKDLNLNQHDYFVITVGKIYNPIGIYGNKLNIRWTNENYGYILSNNCESLCFKPLHGIKCAIYEYLGSLVKSRYSVDVDKIIYGSLKRIVISDGLGNYYKDYPFKIVNIIMTKIRNIIKPLLEANLRKFNMLDPNISNFIFLALLGKKRDWKSECAICLTDKIMGTTCTCGHTEIAVFRPCGHSICANPCFYNFMESKNIKLETQKIISDNKEYYIPTQQNIDVHFGNDTNLECPLCRQKIIKTFRAEEIMYNENDNLIDVQNIAKDIYDAVFDQPNDQPNDQLIGQIID